MRTPRSFETPKAAGHRPFDRRRRTMSLKGKTLFITGASRGIGLAIALRAARDGANIAIAAKTETPHPKLPGTIYTAAEEIDQAGGQALPLVVDVRDEAQVKTAIDAPSRRSAASISWSTMPAPCRARRWSRPTCALRPDASDQHARHVHGVQIRHPASRQERQSAHPDESRRRSTCRRSGLPARPPTRWPNSA